MTSVPRATIVPVVVLGLLSMLPASQYSPARATPSPEEYGSNTYSSPDPEEARLRAVETRARSLGALGSARESKNAVMIRLPSTTVGLPRAGTIAGFHVTYAVSQFSATSLRATEAAIVTAASEDGHRSTFGFAYDASVDRIRVGGRFSTRMLKSLDRMSGLDVRVTEAVGRAG